MAADTRDRALDPVRERFAQEYHVTGNASEAYRRANPKAKKWKQNSLNVEASRLLSEPKVSLRLEQRLIDIEEQGYSLVRCELGCSSRKRELLLKAIIPRVA